MTELSGADLRGALELVRRVESVSDLASFGTETLAALNHLIPSDVALLEVIDPVRGRADRSEVPGGVTSAEQAEAFELYMDQHPALAHVARTGDPTPLRISDFIGRRELHRLDFYDSVLRPTGIEHQIALTVDAPAALVVGITLNRSHRDFAERDRHLLTLLRPHLSTARQNAELRQLHLAAQQLPEGATGVALLSDAGPILAANAAAKALLSAYFDGGSRPAYLPEALERWVVAERRRGNGQELISPSAPLSIEGPRGRLVVRILPTARQAEPDTLVLSESRSAIDADALREHGLTRREIEVLEMVVRGATVKRTALELGISARTVDKHLERIYRKLGVPSRTAAVARVQELAEADEA